MEGWFQGCTKLTTITGLNVGENTLFGTESFDNCFALKKITFSDTSVIGQDINFVDCNLLTDESLKHIAEHLKDFLPEWKEGDGNKATITFHATVKERIKNTEIENLIKSKKWGIA